VAFGAQIIAMDYNRTCWYSDLTDWRPVNGTALIALSSQPSSILPSSGTINTGASGNLTLTTALDTTYNDGAWVYLPAVASTPAITAGLYWVVFSSTTVGTIFTAGPASAAINFSAGLGYTQTTGAALLLTPVGVPVLGGSMGLNGALFSEWFWTRPNTANGITTQINFGVDAAATGNATVASSFGGRSLYHIRNRGSAAKNIRFHPAGYNPGFPGAAAYQTINTAVNQTLTALGQLAVATDYLVLAGFNVSING